MYKAFLEILNMYRKGQKSITQVYDEVRDWLTTSVKGGLLRLSASVQVFTHQQQDAGSLLMVPHMLVWAVEV